MLGVMRAVWNNDKSLSYFNIWCHLWFCSDPELKLTLTYFTILILLIDWTSKYETNYQNNQFHTCNIDLGLMTLILKPGLQGMH